MQASSFTAQDKERDSRKKRRLPGSCDNCKNRKVKCDSSKMPGNRCTNCVNADLVCTHELLTRNLRSAKGYVEQLERRLARMQKLLNRVMPHMDIERELEKESDDGDELIRTPEPPLQRNDDEETLKQFTVKFRSLALDPASRRYQGKSSHLYLLQSILNHKFQSSPSLTGAPFPWIKRKEFWNPQPWSRRSVLENSPVPAYDFPPEDLMGELIESYFVNLNLFKPVLHRPSLEDGLRNNLHRTDRGFASVVLLVCAIGSRFSHDPRVFLQDVEFTRQSAGWRWFEQVPALRTSNFDERATLYELQSCVLDMMYNAAVSSAPGTWVQGGLGLRMAIDVGAHRKRTGTDSEPLKVEDELWKRVFWSLLTIEVAKSSIEGLPCMISREDYDLDYPMALDDDESLAIMAWTSSIKLRVEIQADILRAIYPTRKPKRHDARVPELSELQAIANLDSALNKWLSDDIPPALTLEAIRSGPHSRTAEILSHYLYIGFYGTQILLHKPYIPTLNVNGEQSSISSAMCLSAARSIAGIIELPILQENRETGPFPLFKRAAFSAGLILVTTSWSGQHSSWAKGSQSNVVTNRLQDDLKHVQSCLDFLKASEERYNTAGKLWDLLSQAVAIGNMSVPNSNEISAKRARTEETVDTPSTVNTDELNVPNYAYPTTESPGDLYGDFSQFTQVLPSGLDQTFDDPWSIPGATDTDPTASLWFNPPSSYEWEEWAAYFDALAAGGQPAFGTDMTHMTDEML